MDTNETLNLILNQISDMNKKFDKIDERFDSIDEKFNKVNLELATINRKLDGVIEHNTNIKYQIEELQARSIANTREIVKLKNQRDIDASTEIINQVLENIRSKNR